MDTATTTTTAEELKTAATRVREAARGTAAGPWKASPVWSPDAAVTSAVYSHAHPAGTPESEVVASGQKRYRKGGLRNPCNAVWIALANPDLAEPLASWLEYAAKEYDEEVYKDDIGCNAGTSLGVAHCDVDCPGHRLRAMCDRCGNPIDAPELIRCHCWDSSLAVARVINGGAR